MSPTAFPTNSRSFPSSITIALPSSRLPHDLLHLRVLFHPEAPALAADAALLEAAEGRVEEVDAVVDPHHPGADALGERDRPRGVARQHHAAEPVGGVVRGADRLVLVREGDHGHDGPEDLLLRDADPVGHRAEDGRLEEVAAPEVLRPAAAVGEAACGAIRSRLSVSRKMATDLPPSSRWTRFKVFAAASKIFLPVATLPVKLTLSMRGSETSVSAIAFDCPVTKLTTPGGRSVSAMISARKRLMSGP